MSARLLTCAVLAVLAVGAAGCGDDAQLVGYQLQPATEVGDLTLPDAATGAPVAMRAADGELMLMYFGYTACPDVCPTTLASVRSALRGLDEDEASRIALAMATVDPARDTADVLPAYVQHFVDDAVGLRTEDDAELRAVADRFGASYSVTGSGDDTEVTHSGALYVVDDGGLVLDVLPFGVTADDIRNDLEILLEQA